MRIEGGTVGWMGFYLDKVKEKLKKPLNKSTLANCP